MKGFKKVLLVRQSLIAVQHYQCTRVPHEDGGRGLCVCLRTPRISNHLWSGSKIVDNGVGERVVCVSSDRHLTKQIGDHNQSATTTTTSAATTRSRISLCLGREGYYNNNMNNVGYRRLHTFGYLCKILNSLFPLYSFS